MCVYGYKVNIYASNTNSVASEIEKILWRLRIDCVITVERVLICHVWLINLNVNQPACCVPTEGGKRERWVKFLGLREWRSKIFHQLGKGCIAKFAANRSRPWLGVKEWILTYIDHTTTLKVKSDVFHLFFLGFPPFIVFIALPSINPCWV